ncbi:hypothetical protein Ais01nite_01210 [Asanoa ishikariensis]|uniref:sigma factor-like helix-turn-helix DNA-binding protein n=1 Tax=Asanoa ishikariensis TaxID=137265 RepID=UPI001A3EDB8F|nr:sigma factor-like helix-turn-helix DNA-binding protein [Asanoa ishikariensis]GIF62086.1 hypothetical protein Ais01nite_01210 [Asanoa ishikariensis]
MTPTAPRISLPTRWPGPIWRELITSDPPERAAYADHGADLATRDSVMRSLRGLTHRERAVVVLRYFLDRTEKDTAAELGVSVGTVKSTNARALKKLRVSPELTARTGRV